MVKASSYWYNIIGTNFAHSNGLQEHEIYTTFIVDSGNEVPCHSASFNISIHIGNDIFRIDVLLLDIGNNFYVMLSMPWLTSLGCITWDFTTMELLYFRNGHPYRLHTMPRRQAPTTILALPTHQPMLRISWTSTTHVPHTVMNRAQCAHLPNALDNIDNLGDIIFTYMH